MQTEVRVGLDEVLRHFSELEDPRSEINKRHPLPSVIVIALMAVLAGADGPTGRRPLPAGRSSKPIC